MKRYLEIYRAEQLPIFQNQMFHSEKEAINCVRGDVVLVQNLKTGLIFNQVFKSELMKYNADYQNEQAVSTFFQWHLQDVSEIIQKHFQGHSLIEVGCGKGHFLEQLQGIGFDITGWDPTYEGSNPSIVKKFFSPEAGQRAEGIILRHVLEHVQEPVEFISKLRDVNGGGKIYIEVPCFDWICEHRAWFDIFYEHVNYFRLTDFSRMFGSVYEAGHTFNGQYLYVVADLATIRVPDYDAQDRFEFPGDFFDTVEQLAVRLRAQSKYTVWGGASKGVIFALFMERAGAKVEMVIDINPAKQGKFLAATGIKVLSPEDAMCRLSPGADVYVMNGNYLNEVKNLTANQFNYLLVEHERL